MMFSKNRKGARALFLTLLLLTALFLSSCSELVLPSVRGESVTIDEFLVKIENRQSAEQTIAGMPAMKGIPQRISGDVIITEETTDGNPIVRLYNLLTGKLLRTIDDGHEVGFVSDHLNSPANAAGIYYMVHNDILYVCNADGSEAISTFYGKEDGGERDDTEGDDVSEGSLWPNVTEGLFTDSLNGFSFNGVNYFVRDGAIVFEGDHPLESSYFNASVEYGGLYYYIGEDLAFVFDEKGTLLYEYRLPSYAVLSNIFVLNNGNLFMQYAYTVIDGEEYDTVVGAEKYKLVSILANVEKRTETEPILSFFVVDCHNAFTDEDFHERYTEKVTNLATIIEIKNKRVDENALPRSIVLTDNLIELFSPNDIVTGAVNFQRISYDRYLVTTSAGSLLASGDGTVLGQLNNYLCITEKFIVTSGAVYDHDLNQIYVLSEEGYTYYTSVGNNIILSRILEEKAYLYLFSDNEPRLIGEVQDFLTCFEGYALKGDDERYHYYNENAEELIATEGVIQWIYDKTEEGVSNHVGYIVDAEGNTDYYHLFFTNLAAIK